MSWTVQWIDLLIFSLLALFWVWLNFFSKTQEWKFIIAKILEKSRYLVALMILMLYVFVGVIDSIHFKKTDPDHGKVVIFSVLDLFFKAYAQKTEISYSMPFSLVSFTPEVVKKEDGTFEQHYLRLRYTGQHLEKDSQKWSDIFFRAISGIAISSLFTGAIWLLFRLNLRGLYRKNIPYKALKAFFVTFFLIGCFLSVSWMLMSEYHIFGTDKIGRDVYYLSIKSIRTGLVIGSLTLLVMLPFSLIFGMCSGYFRGWIDDIIQYLYTTLSSVPGILLIAAAMLSLQSKIEESPDLRLLILCTVMGITSWTSLCRLLRAETLKLRELDYVQSAKALGVKPLQIIRHHIMPHLMHLVIITLVLDFSGLVLAEAVLSYVGVGVDPVSYSWGNMINAARLDMGREPVVWWSLGGAFFFMFTLVFAANIFADALQEALNPKEN